VDYIFQLTAEEQRRVSASMGRARAANGGAKAAGNAAAGHGRD